MPAAKIGNGGDSEKHVSEEDHTGSIRRKNNSSLGDKESCLSNAGTGVTSIATEQSKENSCGREKSTSVTKEDLREKRQFATTDAVTMENSSLVSSSNSSISQNTKHPSSKRPPSSSINGHHGVNKVKRNDEKMKSSLLQEEQQEICVDNTESYHLPEHNHITLPETYQPLIASQDPPLLPPFSAMLFSVLTGYEDFYHYNHDMESTSENNEEKYCQPNVALRSLLSSRFFWYFIHLARCHNPIYYLHGGAGPTPPQEQTKGDLMSLSMNFRSVFKRKGMLWLGMLAEIVIACANLSYVLPAYRKSSSPANTLSPRIGLEDVPTEATKLWDKPLRRSLGVLSRMLNDAVSTVTMASRDGNIMSAADNAAHSMLAVLNCLGPTVEVWARSKYYLSPEQRGENLRKRQGRVILSSPRHCYWSVWNKIEWVKFVCRMVVFLHRVSSRREYLEQRNGTMTNSPPNIYVGRRTGVAMNVRTVNGCASKMENSATCEPHLHNDEIIATNSASSLNLGDNRKVGLKRKMSRLFKQFCQSRSVEQEKKVDTPRLPVLLPVFPRISYTFIAAEVFHLVRPLLWTTMQMRQHRVFAKTSPMSTSSGSLRPVLVPHRLLPRLRPWILTLFIDVLSIKLAQMEERNQRDKHEHRDARDIRGNFRDKDQDGFLPTSATQSSRVPSANSSVTLSRNRWRRRRSMLWLYLLRTPVYDWLTSPVVQTVARFVTRIIPVLGHRLASSLLFWLDYYQSNHYMIEDACGDEAEDDFNGP